MSRASHRHLLALNAVLIAGLALLTFSPGATGQPGGSSRPRAPGQYALVSAQYQGATDRAIVVADTNNEELIVLKWDRSRKVFEGIGYRDLKADSELALKRQGGGGR